MDDERLERLLRPLDESTEPAPDFADRLYSRLATDLGVGVAVERPRGRPLGWRRPATATRPRPAARSRGRWTLVLVGAVVVTVGGFVALSSQPTGFTCDEGAIDDVRAAVAAVPGYTYSAQGQYREFNNTFPVDIEGEFQSPNKVRELHLDEDGAASLQIPYGGEWLRVGERIWVHYADQPADQLPWTAVRGDAFGFGDFLGFPRFLYRSVPENPALFALDGLVEPAADLEWTAASPGSQVSECTLTGTRRSPQNGALMSVTTWVDPGTALPQRLVWELTGYAPDGSRDRRLEYEFRYGQTASSISPPPSDRVQPESSLPPGVSFPPQSEMTLTGTGEYLR